jgi:hypothetical protein
MDSMDHNFKDVDSKVVICKQQTVFSIDGWKQ